MYKPFLVKYGYKKSPFIITFFFSSSFFRIIGLCCYLISTKLVKKLIVSTAEIEEIKTNRDPTPVLYVVKNQTNFDWFVVLFLLFFLNLKPPIVFLPRRLKPRFRYKSLYSHPR